MDRRPIGMFDSGFGGLTVARALIDLMPEEDLVYLGDTARYPYGSRSLDEVAAFSRQIAEHLIADHGVKLLVVACNTASAAALDELAEHVDVPVVGVIEPGVRALLEATVTGHVGVIGTVGTIASGAYQAAVADLDATRAGSTELCGGGVPRFRRVRRARRLRFNRGAPAGGASAGARVGGQGRHAPVGLQRIIPIWPARSSTCWVPM
ncbi:MAG: glutamate racemase [Microthrixaceae bacterium]|nr:glutamate racemase [Microthrixaceae bacterium]